MLLILVDVLLTFGLVVTYPFGPTAGFFDFQPGVYVVLEEASREMSGRTNDGEVLWWEKMGEGVFGVKQPMAVKSREPKKQ